MYIVFNRNFVTDVIGISDLYQVRKEENGIVAENFSFEVYTEKSTVKIKSANYVYYKNHPDRSSALIEVECLKWQMEFCNTYIKIYTELTGNESGDVRMKELDFILKQKSIILKRIGRLTDSVLGGGN